MAEYYDYGALGDTSAPLVQIKNTRYSQVYAATHKGEKYLPFMERSFISFSYGGKNIEDFDLIATIESNSLQRKAYAEFNDIVTQSDVYDGQLYWSSHFEPNVLDFILATDGITEQKLDEFKQYFKPGTPRELILAEHPNRAIFARVMAAPELDLLPFEGEGTVKIAEKEYTTSTTLYKGQIKLSLVMDEPFWHSVINVLGKPEGSLKQGYWIDANGESSYILNDKDALKVIMEDNVPTVDMLYNLKDNSTEQNFLFGQKGEYRVDYAHSKVAKNDNDLTHARVYQKGIAEGYVAYHIASNFENNVLKTGEPLYLYYAGTAPCAPILTFSFSPTLNTNGYIDFPKNSIGSTSGNKYNTIIIEQYFNNNFVGEKRVFKFTTPGIYTGYNQAIRILRNYSNKEKEEVISLLKENVKHYAPREFAIYIVSKKDKEVWVNTMESFIRQNPSIGEQIDTYTFNCKTGEATATIFCNKFINNGNLTKDTLKENVGDMVKSNYLIIEGRDYPYNGYISTNYIHKITTDATGDLSKFNIEYKYMYL